MNVNGLFLTLEGGEGSGKTTQIVHLKSYFESLGYEVVTTREPGGVPIAEKIRWILLNPEVTDMDAMTEVLLYCASRREHFIHVILPALTSGKVVISDRFFDSSIVYQGFVKGFGWEKVYQMNLEAVQGTQPDLTFYLDIPPAVGMARIQSNVEREQNRFDRASLDFHHKIRKGYQFLAAYFPNRIVSINAEKHAEEVSKDLISILHQRLKLN